MPAYTWCALYVNLLKLVLKWLTIHTQLMMDFTLYILLRSLITAWENYPGDIMYNVVTILINTTLHTWN